MRRAARDIGVAILGFALIMGVSYTLGRALVPAFPQALGDLDLSPTTTVGEGGGVLTLEEMHEEVAADDFPAVAYVQVEGAIEGAFRLNLTDYREWQDEGVVEGPTLDLDMKYYSGYDTNEPTLTITARGLEVGSPRTERYTVVLSQGVHTFLADPGQCSIELLDLRFTTLPPAFGSASSDDRTMPVFLAQAVCEGVEVLRGDDTVSFTVVFDYDPDQFEVFG